MAINVFFSLRRWDDAYMKIISKGWVSNKISNVNAIMDLVTVNIELQTINFSFDVFAKILNIRHICLPKICDISFDERWTYILLLTGQNISNSFYDMTLHVLYQGFHNWRVLYF